MGKGSHELAPGRRTSHWRGALGILTCLAACLPFLFNFVAWTASSFDRVQKLRRYGEDMSVATTGYLERRHATGAPAVKLSSIAAQRYGLDLQAFMLQREQALGLRPWQFWRTLPDDPPARPGPIVYRSNDDVGRAALTKLGFRLLGGVAPFLPLWLAALACLPVLAWMVWELAGAGHRVAGTAFAIACGCSPFFVESMALPYSAFGFYLVGLLAIAAFAVYAIMRPPGGAGFLLRALALGPLLAVCALCRDGILLALPGLLLAMVLGARRIVAAAKAGPSPWRRGRSLGLVLLALLAVALPYALVRPPTHHEMWTGVWMGLGDFDRTKGHVWSDTVAVQLLIDAGLDAGVPPEVEMFDRELASPEKEAFFRGLVLQDVRSDPLWYIAILGRRLVATVTQDELLVLGGRSAASEQARRGPNAPIPSNQGRIRFFYRLVPTADSIGLGPWRRALPLGVLWALGAAFVYAAVRDQSGRGARPGLLVAGCVACSALPLPVLITTAGALETEAFVLVYFLAFAFVVEWVWLQARQAWPRSLGHEGPGGQAVRPGFA
jgi:hypothetical protein